MNTCEYYEFLTKTIIYSLEVVVDMRLRIREVRQYHSTIIHFHLQYL